MNKRKTALFLTLTMVLGLIIQPSTVRATQEEIQNQQLEAVEATGQLSVIKELDASIAKGVTYDPNEEVVFIVEVEGDTLIDSAEDSVADYAASKAGEKENQKILDTQEKVKSNIKKKNKAASFKESDSFTTVINAFTLKAPYKDLKELEEVTGVKRVYVAGKYDVPVTEKGNQGDMAFSTETIGSDLANESGYTGKGTAVAVLDTGLDYNHEAFSVSPEEVKFTEEDMEAIVKDKSEVLNSGTAGTIISDKVIFAYDYADKDGDVYPGDSTHGVHVAGTVAGNNGDDFVGVAPDAQLMIMKVFSDTDSGAYDSDIIAALEDAVLLGADVINMSLGSPSGFTESAEEVTKDIYDRVATAGVNLMVSAGNEYHQGYQIDDYSLPYADTPDYGLVGSPSTYGSSLSVASVENTKLTTNYFEAGENSIAYVDNGPSSMLLSTLSGKTYEYAFANYGTPEDFASLDIEGKVALISRGVLSFTEKVTNAYNAGAAAVIVFNNQSGTISMSVENYYIPAVSITQADGLAMVQAENKFVTFTSEVKSFPSDTAGEMSDFSSWGTAPNLSLKPEITAPGGNIYSSVAGGGYESMSGTSMAAPQMSGAAAVLKEYVNKSFSDMDAANKYKLINNILMSTASPIAEGEEGYYSPRKQGSGLVNIYDAITSEAYLYTGNMDRPKAELGDNKTGKFTFTFTVYNYGEAEKTYKPSLHLGTDSQASDGVASYNILTSNTLKEGTDYSVKYYVGNKQASEIKVNPGQAVNVKVTFDVKASTLKSLKAAFTNGFYIEGFVFITSEDSVDLSMPFLGFYGDWDKLQLFDGTVYDEDAYYYNSLMQGMFFYNDSYYYYDTLGENSFTGKLDPDNIAYSPYYVQNKYGLDSETWLSTDTGLLRNAEDVKYTITNSIGKVVESHDYYYGDESKSFYYLSGGYVTSLFDYEYLLGDFNGTTLPEGNYKLTISAKAAEGEKAQDLTYKFYVDTTAPKYKGYNVYASEGETLLKLFAKDDHSVQGINLYLLVNTPSGYAPISMDDVAYYVDSLYSDEAINKETYNELKASIPTMVDYSPTKGKNTTMTWNITGYSKFEELFKDYVPVLFGDDVTLVEGSLYAAAIDYAWNMDGYYPVTLGKAAITVVDQEGLPVVGATVSVGIDKYTTNENGQVLLSNLKEGKYKVSLTKLPKGYVKNGKSDGTITISSKAPYGEVTFTVNKK